MIEAIPWHTADVRGRDWMLRQSSATAESGRCSDGDRPVRLRRHSYLRAVHAAMEIAGEVGRVKSKPDSEAGRSDP